MDENNLADGDIYVLMVHDFVVLKDLADTVREFDPRARVLTGRSCAETFDLVKGLDRLTIAFVEAGSEAVAQSHLDAEVRQRGGRIVLLGDDAEDEWEGGGPRMAWPVLLRPFSTQTVVQLLNTMLPRPA